MGHRRGARRSRDGAQTVTFDYRPRSVTAGVALTPFSALGILVLLLLVPVARRRTRRRLP
jgi:hypothetical protein